MLENYGLIINSKKEHDIPIAMIGDKIISLSKIPKGIKAVKEIKDDKYDIHPIPYIPPNMNIRYFVGGASGCGKSHFVSHEILENYTNLYPEQEIYIFSVLDDDPVYEENEKIADKINRISLDELDDLTVDDLAKSICIFDDAVSTDKQKNKTIKLLKDNVFQHGRHHKTDIISIYDKLCDGNATKKEHTQSKYISFFPSVTSQDELEYLFKKMGINKSVLNNLMENNTSRWIMVNKHHPRYVVASNMVKLI